MINLRARRSCSKLVKKLMSTNLVVLILKAVHIVAFLEFMESSIR